MMEMADNRVSDTEEDKETITHNWETASDTEAIR